MALNNKKEQPSQTKISISIMKCKDNIQDMLNLYNGKVEEYITKLVSLKKEKRYADADRCKDRLKVVLANQTKMEDLMDQVEQFEFMINEAFAKYNLYNTLGTALEETNKIVMAPEIKRIIKDLANFEKVFTKNCSRFDSIFGKVKNSVSKIDSNTYSQDAEIEAIVNGRLKEYDEKTTKIATDEISSIFDFSN